MSSFMKSLALGMWLLAHGLAFSQVGAGLWLSGVASQIDGDSWGGYEKVGFGVGGFAWYNFSEKVGLQTEISFGHRGSREVVEGFGQYALNFIDVPVLLRYRFWQAGNLGVSLETGPGVSFLLSARNGFKPNQVDNTEFFSRYNAEAHLGLSGNFGSAFTIFMRWSMGLNNLWAFTPRPWMTIHYFSLGVRVGFIHPD
jgi:hypothetical protein